MNDVLLTAAMIIAPLAAVLAILWQRTLVNMVPFAVALTGLPLVIGSTNVRADQVLAVILSLVLATAILLRQRRLYLDTTSKWLAVVAFLHFFSSVAFSPNPRYSVQQTASLLAVWALYIVVTNFVATRHEFTVFFRRVLVAGGVATALGVLAFALGWLGLPVGGANMDPDSPFAYGAFGTMYEPNIFGSYSLAYLSLGLALVVVSPALPRRHVPHWVWPLVAVSGLGLVLSFTRGAWVGAIVALVGMLLLARRYFGIGLRPSRVLGPFAILAVLFATFWFLPFEAAEFFRYKVRNLVNVDSPNVVFRFLTLGLATEQFIRNPILGWGTYSFAPLTVEGLPFREFEGWHGLWISNFVMQALHDVGVVGFLAYAGMLWTLFARALRTLRVSVAADREFAAWQMAAIAGFGSLLVPFLFTTGFGFGYPWMFAGLVGAASRAAEQSGSSTAGKLSLGQPD